VSSPQASLQMPLHVDRWRHYAGVLMLLLAAIASMLSGLAWWLKALLLVLLLVTARYHYWNLQRAGRWRMLQCTLSGQWTLLDTDNNEIELEPGAGHLISPYLIVIHGKAAGQQQHLWFWRHRYPREEFRKLSLKLYNYQYDSDRT